MYKNKNLKIDRWVIELSSPFANLNCPQKQAWATCSLLCWSITFVLLINLMNELYNIVQCIQFGMSTIYSHHEGNSIIIINNWHIFNFVQLLNHFKIYTLGLGLGTSAFCCFTRALIQVHNDSSMKHILNLLGTSFCDSPILCINCRPIARIYFGQVQDPPKVNLLNPKEAFLNLTSLNHGASPVKELRLLALTLQQ